MSRRSDLLARRVACTVVVTLKDGDTTFRGRLHAVDDRTLVLRNSDLVSEAGAEPVPVDGELVLLLAEILYIQRLPEGATP